MKEDGGKPSIDDFEREDEELEELCTDYTAWVQLNHAES